MHDHRYVNFDFEWFKLKVHRQWPICASVNNFRFTAEFLLGWPFCGNLPDQDDSSHSCPTKALSKTRYIYMYTLITIQLRHLSITIFHYQCSVSYIFYKHGVTSFLRFEGSFFSWICWFVKLCHSQFKSTSLPWRLT